jgi:hypothetical protein
VRSEHEVAHCVLDADGVLAGGRLIAADRIEAKLEVLRELRERMQQANSGSWEEEFWEIKTRLESAKAGGGEG